MSAVQNSIPVLGSYPGWSVGNNKAGIEIEVVIDLECGDCLRENAVWNEVLKSKWLDSTVEDQVQWRYSLMPEPYHFHGFAISQVVPYLQAKCATDNKCLLNEYRDWVYSDDVHRTIDDDAMKLGKYEFQSFWALKVAEQFKFD